MAFFCKRRGICPSCGTRRMAEAAAHLVDHVIPMVPVRQWVLSFPIPLRSLFAVHPDLLAPILQIIHRAIATLLIEQTGIKRDQAATGAVTLIQRFGSATSDRYTENWSTPITDRFWPAAVSQFSFSFRCDFPKRVIYKSMQFVRQLEWLERKNFDNSAINDAKGISLNSRAMHY